MRLHGWSHVTLIRVDQLDCRVIRNQPGYGVCEMKPCDPEGQQLTSEIAEQESHDLENKLTNQITASRNQSLPTTTADSEIMVTSSDISTNHSTEPSHMTWTLKGDWVAPSITYRQNDKRVVFVLHSSGVKPSTLVHHHDNHQVQHDILLY